MKKILLIMAAMFSLIGINAEAFATSNATQFGAVETNILTNCGSKDGAEGIICILNLVVDIMTIGVGILGVIAISVVGIQYLTAGGSEEKTRTAKRRIFEIVIGLAAYAVIYALLKWLLPGFSGTP